MPHLHKMQVSATPMPHAGNLLARVMKQRILTKTALAQKMGVVSGGINQYCKQSTLHAALLWKLGEVLEYNFFAELARAFPVNNVSEQELALQQQISDLKKENELYQKILAGRLG